MAFLLKRGKRYSLVQWIDGKKVFKSLKTGDKTIAEIKMGEILKEHSAVSAGVSVDAAWSVGVERFFEERSKMILRDGKPVEPRTLEIDRRAFFNLETTIAIMPRGPRKELRALQRISELTPELLLEVKLYWRKQRGVSVRNRDLRALKAVGRLWERTYKLPPKDWTLLKEEPEASNAEWFEIEEYDFLLRNTKGTWRTTCILGGRLGLRPGEIYSLPWKRVDLKTRNVRIDDYKDWHPKNEASKRYMPIPDDAHAYLTELRKKYPTAEYVIHDVVDHRGERVGRPTQGSFEVYFRKILKKLKLRGSLYTLRHTFGGGLASMGVDLWTIARLMGHSSIKHTTVYAHLYNSALVAASNRQPALPGGAVPLG